MCSRSNLKSWMCPHQAVACCTRRSSTGWQAANSSVRQQDGSAAAMQGSPNKGQSHAPSFEGHSTRHQPGQVMRTDADGQVAPAARMLQDGTSRAGRHIQSSTFCMVGRGCTGQVCQRSRLLHHGAAQVARQTLRYGVGKQRLRTGGPPPLPSCRRLAARRALCRSTRRRGSRPDCLRLCVGRLLIRGPLLLLAAFPAAAAAAFPLPRCAGCAQGLSCAARRRCQSWISCAIWQITRMLTVFVFAQRETAGRPLGTLLIRSRSRGGRCSSCGAALEHNVAYGWRLLHET